MSLTQELENFKNDFLKSAPTEVVSEMSTAHEQLLKDGIGENALGVGGAFPNFTLTNAKESKVSFEDLFGDNDKLIISFYRGGWCPYCNLELKALQNHIEDFKKLGASLVAITPEKPDHSLSTVEKNELSFEVLTDLNSELAKEIKLSFELPENLKPLYQQFGIEVEKYNGDYSLPIPATFIVNRSGDVLYRFLDLDYTVRLDPKEILNFLGS